MKLFALTFLSLFTLCCAAQEHYLLVGTYDSPKSEGIYVYRFSSGNGTAVPVSHIRSSNPSFLAVSPDERSVYAVFETAPKDGKGGDVAAFGKKMYRTHEGLSREYGVSCKELDYLADFVKAHPEVIGARMMGGGFGGCTINIIKKEAVEPLINELLPLYKRDMGLELKYYRVEIENGTSRI